MMEMNESNKIHRFAAKSRVFENGFESMKIEKRELSK
jgi:hypothetical protein